MKKLCIRQVFVEKRKCSKIAQALTSIGSFLASPSWRWIFYGSASPVCFSTVLHSQLLLTFGQFGSEEKLKKRGEMFWPGARTNCPRDRQRRKKVSRGGCLPRKIRLLRRRTFHKYYCGCICGCIFVGVYWGDNILFLCTCG